MNTQIANVLVALTLISGAARGDMIQTYVGDFNLVASNGTTSLINPNNGLPSSISWTGVGHVNGPTDIGASISATYTNFDPAYAYNSYGEGATFTDLVTFNESPIDIGFNFTIDGSATLGSGWQVFLSLGGAPPISTGFSSANGDFLVHATANDGPGQYSLLIELIAWSANFTDSPPPPDGANLTLSADYNDTLSLDSVTLAPGETMIGQSGVNYSQLSASTVPEPGTVTLLITALALLLGAKLLRRSKAIT